MSGPAIAASVAGRVLAAIASELDLPASSVTLDASLLGLGADDLERTCIACAALEALELDDDILGELQEGEWVTVADVVATFERLVAERQEVAHG